MRAIFTLCFAIVIAVSIGGCSDTGDPADVVGTWVVEPESVDNAAFNMVRVVSDRAGRNLSDAEIEPVAKELAEKMRKTPAEYNLNADGTFEAVSGEGSADGTWMYSKKTLKLESPSRDKPARFLVGSGGLLSLSDSPRHRNVRLVRKESLEAHKK